ncbi:MAG TPA: hypothetical protein VHY91_24920 [Pirellulales bacterium]|jgi:hypothetical protein|nr:hypothetical protein [Pirellulales bacterium]
MSQTFSAPMPGLATESAETDADLEPTARGNLGRVGIGLLMLGSVVVYLGPSLVLEYAYGNRATVFNDDPSSRPEITAYYQTFRGLEEGHMPWRDPQLADFADRLIPPTMALPQTIGAVFTAPFDERIHWGGNIAVTLAVVALVWLLARILRELAPGEKSLQALGIALVVFGGQELYGFGALKSGLGLILNVFSQSRNFLYLNRLTSPALTVPLFVLALLLWGAAVKTERNRYFVGAGIVTGLLAYSYIYHWMVGLGALGVSMIFEYLAGRKAVAWRLSGALGIAMLVSLPFVATCVVADRAPYTADTFLRRGFEMGRMPAMCVEVVMLTVWTALVLLLVKPGWQRRCWLALIAGIWMTRWSNVVLGKDIATDHVQWHAMVAMIPPLGIACLAAIERRAIGRWLRMSHWLPAVCYVLTVLAFTYGVCYQIGSLRRYWPDFERPADAVEMARYLREEVPHGVVVAELPHETLRMAVYSRNFPYLSHAGPVPMSNRELEDRLLIHGRLYGLSEQQIVDNYTSVFSLHLTPEPQLSQLADRFRQRIVAGDSPDRHLYQIDYVLSRAPLDRPDLKLLHQIGGLRLYEFRAGGADGTKG